MGVCMIRTCGAAAMGWAKDGERKFHLCNKHLMRARRRPWNWRCQDCEELPAPDSKRCKPCQEKLPSLEDKINATWIERAFMDED